MPPVYAETPNSANNIITGSAALYLGALGAAIPSFPTTAAGAAAGLVIDPTVWTKVGFTKAGLVFDYQPTNKDINVDEAMSPIKVLKTAEMLKFTAQLSEATLENMNRAISGASLVEVAAGAGVAGSVTLHVGGSQQQTYYSAMIVGPGPGPNFYQRILVGYRVYSTAKLSLAMKKDDEVIIPVEFTGLADTTRAVGDQLCQITEMRAPSTT